jgi:hypothetical protein
MTPARSAPAPARVLLRPVAEGLLTGTLAAALSALAAAWRVAHAGVPWAQAWLALAGSAAIALGPLSAALRVARPAPRWSVGVPVGLVLAAAPLMIFAKLLKASTHYWPLSAVTFAIVAAGIVVSAFAVALRLLAAARAAEPTATRTLARVVLAALLLAGLALALRLAAPAFGANALDATLALGLCAAGAVAPLPRRAGQAGWLVWIAIVLAGALTLRAAPSVATRARERAPVLLGPGSWLIRPER